MKRLIVVLTLSVAAVSFSAGPTGAAPGGTGGKTKCFTGSPALCEYNSFSASYTLDTRDGGYAGVYASNGKSLAGSSLSSVDFSFDYSCFAQVGVQCVTGGSPRLSIPIDENGDGSVEGYAFVDAANCAQIDLTGTVSTNDPACQVFYGSGAYANWDAFAATNPTYTIASALTFMIADQRFHGRVFDVSFTRS